MTKNFTDLTGRVAVVIGATSGIGRAIAKGLAASGAKVVPSGRRLELVQEVCNEIVAAGGEAFPAGVDITDRSSVEALRDLVCDRWSGVDVLMNVAGFTVRSPTMEVTEETWDSIIDTNLTGMLRTCQTFYEPLRASGRGRIVNIASLASFVALHQVTAYGVSKAGVLSLTRSLGCEWARDSINVNALVPGVFVTAINEAALNGTDRGRELLMRTPMKRFGRVEELVGAAVFLSSDAASFITGQSLAVDGGFLASGVNS